MLFKGIAVHRVYNAVQSISKTQVRYNSGLYHKTWLMPPMFLGVKKRFGPIPPPPEVQKIIHDEKKAVLEKLKEKDFFSRNPFPKSEDEECLRHARAVEHGVFRAKTPDFYTDLFKKYRFSEPRLVLYLYRFITSVSEHVPTSETILYVLDAAFRTTGFPRVRKELDIAEKMAESKSVELNYMLIDEHIMKLVMNSKDETWSLFQNTRDRENRKEFDDVYFYNKIARAFPACNNIPERLDLLLDIVQEEALVIAEIDTSTPTTNEKHKLENVHIMYTAAITELGEFAGHLSESAKVLVRTMESLQEKIAGIEKEIEDITCPEEHKKLLVTELEKITSDLESERLKLKELRKQQMERQGKAEDLFKELSYLEAARPIEVHNARLSVLVRDPERHHDAITLFEKMKAALNCTVTTYNTIFPICQAERMERYIKDFNKEKCSYKTRAYYETVISTYLKNNEYEKAHNIFDAYTKSGKYKSDQYGVSELWDRTMSEYKKNWDTHVAEHGKNVSPTFKRGHYRHAGNLKRKEIKEQFRPKPLRFKPVIPDHYDRPRY